MLKCPVCGRQITVRRGSFACPWCNAKLRLPGTSRLEWSAIGVVVIFVPFLIARWLVPPEYAPLFGGLLVLVLVVPISAVLGYLRGTFSPPKVQRDSGWPDDGTILHITSPPEPPKES